MAKPSAQRSTGRPPRLSQEQILEAALKLLQQRDGQQFSLRQLAQALDTTPGNVYTYFANKESLLDALAEYSLQSLHINPDTDQPWDVQLSQWMQQFRNALKEQPERMLLMGVAGTSASMLRKINTVAKLIEQAGLAPRDAVLQAQSLLWAVMSFTVFELQASDPKVVKQLQQGGEANAEYGEVLQHLAVADLEPLWQATLARNLAGIRVLVGQASASY